MTTLSGKIVWLAMRHPEPDSERAAEVVGVFSTEEKAAAACTEWNRFIGPLEMDTAAPDTEWPGAYYPMARAQETHTSADVGP